MKVPFGFRQAPCLHRPRDIGTDCTVIVDSQLTYYTPSETDTSEHHVLVTQQADKMYHYYFECAKNMLFLIIIIV